jgi:hypothetical protein
MFAYLCANENANAFVLRTPQKISGTFISKEPLILIIPKI